MGTFSRLGGSSTRGMDEGIGELGGNISGSGEFWSKGAVIGDDAAVPA